VLFSAAAATAGTVWPESFGKNSPNFTQKLEQIPLLQMSNGKSTKKF
jgi:hypothetical protein